MGNEIETKTRVGSLAAVRKTLEQAGAEFLGEVIETDQFFDWPDGGLRKADCGLRLRITRIVEKGSQTAQPVKPLLTYKGPKQAGKTIKIRREVQTHLDDPKAVTAILAALGLGPTVVVRKRRRSYRLGACRVELDELRGIGRFVEVEGTSQRTVEAVTRRLGIVGQRVTQSYVSMVAGRRRG